MTEENKKELPPHLKKFFPPTFEDVTPDGYGPDDEPEGWDEEQYQKEYDEERDRHLGIEKKVTVEDILDGISYIEVTSIELEGTVGLDAQGKIWSYGESHKATQRELDAIFQALAEDAGIDDYGCEDFFSDVAQEISDYYGSCGCEDFPCCGHGQ